MKLARRVKNQVRIPEEDKVTETSERAESARGAAEEACCLLDDIDDVIDDVEEDDPEPKFDDYFPLGWGLYSSTEYNRLYKEWKTAFNEWAMRNGQEDRCTC